MACFFFLFYRESKSLPPSQEAKLAIQEKCVEFECLAESPKDSLDDESVSIYESADEGEEETEDDKENKEDGEGSKKLPPGRGKDEGILLKSGDMFGKNAYESTSEFNAIL